MAGLADYLSKNYGGGKKSKKSKHGQKALTTVVIDEGNGLGTVSFQKKSLKESENDHFLANGGGSDAVLVEVSGFERKKKPKGWKEVGGTTSKIREDTVENNEANKTKRSTEKKTKMPQPGLQMFSGGEESEDESEVEANQETVYRDSRGQIVDINEKTQEEEARQRDVEARKRRINQEKNSSDAQILKRQKYEDDLQKIQDVKTTVTVDDNLLNKEMSSRVLQDDPLLAISSTLGGPSSVKPNIPVSKTGRKLYSNGPLPVNRFNIVPGYRWDGVDRSNGFEMKWFNKQYEVQESRALKHSLRDFDE